MPQGRLRTGHAVGIDDAPFRPRHRGDVAIVGAVFSADRLEGVLTSTVRRDGANATDRIAAMVGGSRFHEHLGAVFLQGIAVAGFNVIDIQRLHGALGLPILVVARQQPDPDAIRNALLDHVPGGQRKWRLIERAGSMEPMENLWVQRAGLHAEQARELLKKFTFHGHLPEPLRTAHLIAGGLATGQSRHRP